MSNGSNPPRRCATRWASSAREWAPPLALANGLRWTSVQELFEAKLKASIQSIVLALMCYCNVHQCPPMSTSSVVCSTHIPVVLAFMNGVCVMSPTNEVDIGGH